jgi:hypothetical protein
LLKTFANGQQAEFFVVLADQADLSAARALRTKNEKGRFVHDALWKRARQHKDLSFDGCVNMASSIVLSTL